MLKKTKWWTLIIVVVLAIISLILVNHDDELYQQPLFKITKISQAHSQKVVDDFNNVDHEHSQLLTGVITNGEYQGKQLRVTNTYSDSRGLDQPYRIGEHVFITLHTKPRLHATVKGAKRDTPIWFLTVLALMVMLFGLKSGGLLAIISILINTGLFIVAIKINAAKSGDHVIWLFATLALIFCFITLWLVIGWNRQMLITMTAVVLATGVAVGLSQLVIVMTDAKGIYYESMAYVTQPPKPLFVAQVLIGVLGAAMDVATDIIASLVALKQERPELTGRQIYRSGNQIGRAIMGPLVNVLFFIFMAETLPMTLVYLRNGNTWVYSFAMNMSLGMASTLISAIGIVLTVIFASLLTSWWLKTGGSENG